MTAANHEAGGPGLRERLARAIRESSVAFGPEVARGEARLAWDLEPAPLVIPPDDWAQLSAAVAQRARFANAVLRDLYGPRTLLEDRAVPVASILSDPGFRRPCAGIPLAGQAPATVVRVDLVRTAECGWCVDDLHANTPLGLSFAVQNRQLLTQEAPEVLAALPPAEGVMNLPLELLAHLQQLAPAAAGRRPFVILLSSGPADPFFLEHSYLARKMGVPLARGDDLLVVDQALFLRTISGLQRVDVVYRRLDDEFIDPIALPGGREFAGVPGLLGCLRAGTVAVANLPGCGVAENRALAAASAALLRRLLGERPVLPAWPTLSCGDKDQFDVAAGDPESFAFLPAANPFRATLAPRRAVDPAVVARAPDRFVARRRLRHTAPPGLEGRFEGPWRLACFALCGPAGVRVLPGGLALLGDGGNADGPGLTADVRVLPAPGARPAFADRPVSVSRAEVRPLPSRTAENLYWLGRYLERAEGTARRLMLLEEVALEEIPAPERARWLPVWQGLLESTGSSPAATREHAPFPPDFSIRLALDPTHPGSVVSSLRAAVANARLARDYLSPEALRVLTRLHEKAEDLARRAEDDPADRDARRSACIAETAGGVPSFSGTAERTMLHDAAWHFLQLGFHLERAVMTTGTLRHALAVPGAAAGADREHPEFAALLRMLQTQDAYRRLYQAQSDTTLIAELLLQNADVPRGVRFCLERIRQSLAALDPAAPRDPTHPLQRAERLLLALRETPVAGWRGAESHHGALQEFLDQNLADLLALHEGLSDFYLSHQANLPAGVPPLQPELPLGPSARG